jgi:TolA-binding protein
MTFWALVILAATATNSETPDSGRQVPKVHGDLSEEKVAIDGPQVRMNDVRLQTAWKMDDVRIRQLALIEEMLELEVDDDRYAQLLFRKAELLHERARYYTFSIGSTEDEAAELERQGKNLEAQQLRAKVVQYRTKSKRNQRAAINAYRRIIKDLPDYDRMPEVLHALGQAWWEINFKEAALDTYTRVIREFPDSSFVPDAWLSFGEYYFLNQDLENAVAAYKRAASYTKSKVRPFAEYKLAWTYYNLNDFRAATERFEVVIKIGQEARKAGKAKGSFSLDREARRDWVAAYSHYGKGDTALATITRVAPSDGRNMANRLADIWLGNGKDHLASELLDQLIAAAADDPLLPSYYAKRLRALLRHGDRPRVLAALQQMVDALSAGGGGGDSAATKRWLRSMAEADLGMRQVATRWHSDGAKLKNDSLLNDALAVYKLYMGLMKESVHRHEMRFYQGELLFGMKRFESAAAAYQDAVLINRKGPHAANAVLEMVRSYDALIEAEHAKGKAQDKEKIKERSGRMMAACKLYLEIAPNGEMAPVARYRIAESLYGQERYDEALEAFIKIVDQAADSDLGEVAADQIFDVLQAQKNWRGLLQSARRYAADPRFNARPEFQARAARIADQTNFKVLSISMADLEPADVATGFTNYARNNPSSDYADEAMFNAAVYWEKAGRNDYALSVRQDFVKRFPESEHTGRTYFNLANVYRKTCDYEAAADRLERFANAKPDDELAPSAWLDASVYREDLGDTRAALAGRQAYLNLATQKGSKEKPATVAKVRLSIGKLLNSKIKVARYYDVLARSLKSPSDRLVALGRAADAWRSLRGKGRGTLEGREQAERRLGEASSAAIKAGNKLRGEAADLVAEARIAQLNEPFRQYWKEALPAAADAQAFKAGFVAQIEQLGQLKLDYVEVASIGSPSRAVAALRRIGDLHARFAAKVLEVRAPNGLNAEATMVFQDRLSEQALPYQDKAADHYGTCLSQARKWGVQSEDTKACLGYLVENRADQFPRLDEERPAFGGVWVSAYSALGSLPVAQADLDFLQAASAPAPPSAKKSMDTAEEPPKKKAADKAPTEASAEEEMAKQIRDDGTLETGEGLLFEEDE